MPSQSVLFQYNFNSQRLHDASRVNAGPLFQYNFNSQRLHDASRVNAGPLQAHLPNAPSCSECCAPSRYLPCSVSHTGDEAGVRPAPLSSLVRTCRFKSSTGDTRPPLVRRTADHGERRSLMCVSGQCKHRQYQHTREASSPPQCARVVRLQARHRLLRQLCWLRMQLGRARVKSSDSARAEGCRGACRCPRSPTVRRRPAAGRRRS